MPDGQSVSLVEIRSSDAESLPQFIATIGVNNITVIETADAILIFDKNRAQDVKKIVDELKNKNKTHLL